MRNSAQSNKQGTMANQANKRATRRTIPGKEDISRQMDMQEHDETFGQLPNRQAPVKQLDLQNEDVFFKEIDEKECQKRLEKVRLHLVKAR